MPKSHSSTETLPDTEDVKELRLPSMFAIETHLVAWQGMSATTPANWNLTRFEGDHKKGNLGVDDEDGPRLEMRWESRAKLSISNAAWPTFSNASAAA
jgi:hypothetical protein